MRKFISEEILKKRIAPKVIKFFTKDLIKITSSFFFSESVVRQLMLDYSTDKLMDDEFVTWKSVWGTWNNDGSHSRGAYYPNAGTWVKIARECNETVADFRLPYAEYVDFTTQKNVNISYNLTGEEWLCQDEDREAALAEYKTKKTNYKNEKKLRVSSMEIKNDNYIFTLQPTNFNDIAKTNLTIDWEDPMTLSTLRSKELNISKDTLPDFANSRLANFIGVSAVWISGNRRNRKYFLRCRQSNLSAYYGMLGTVSGYVNPHNAAVKYISLIEFFKDEILREFKEETGYDKYANTKDWKKFIKVIPLAITREFARGGNLQLFFLIKTDEIDVKRFSHAFFNSLDGTHEFVNYRISNIKAGLSPETFVNLIYAFKFLQKDYNIDHIKI